jgi:hypothetical protein
LDKNHNYEKHHKDRHYPAPITSSPHEGAHGGHFDLTEKYARYKTGDHNPFIDPVGYKAYIADREQAFETELKKQSGK